MINRPFVSIVVPIYNIEEYVSKCIDSVLNQTYTDFELILVDDGSPDNCPEICERYAEKDHRVKVIHKENGGLSDARNVGVANAFGEYVIFIDGDDYWDDKNALTKLHKRACTTKADIINFSYKKVFMDTDHVVAYFDKPDMPVGIDFSKQYEYMASNGLLIASACNKLIRRSLLEDIEFEKGVYSEDILWTLAVVNNASSLDFVCENFYCYRQRESSITHTPNDKRCKDLAKAVCDCISLSSSVDEGKKKLFLSYSAFQFGTFILVQAQAENRQNELIEQLSIHNDILKYHGKNRKLFCLHIASSIIGYKNLCKLVRFICKRGRG